MSLSENLTPARYALYRPAFAKSGKGNISSTEGRITTKYENKITVIALHEDLAMYS